MQKEPFHIDPQKIELEETSSTRIHKNMKVEETLLYGLKVFHLFIFSEVM
jgi:hypothetical protein